MRPFGRSDPEVTGVAMETAGAPTGRLGLCVLFALLVNGECSLGCAQRLRVGTASPASLRALYLWRAGFVRTSRVDWVSLLHCGGVTGFRLPPAVGLSPCQS